MKLMKHEKSIRQVLSPLTSTGKQLAVVSLIHNNQMSQTLLWRAPGPSPLSVYFFSITYLPGLAFIVVWTIPKHQVNTHTITKQFILILWVQGRVSAPSPGEGFRLSLDQVTQTLEHWDSLKKERREELNTFIQTVIDEGNVPEPNTDQPDWRHSCDGNIFLKYLIFRTNEQWSIYIWSQLKFSH